MQAEATIERAQARYGGWIKWGSIAAIVVGLLVVLRQLPYDLVIEPFRRWIEDLGLLGMVVFVLIYVLATVALAPGLILTVAAGAIFGLLWGTILVSLGSTAGVALAFLISRYLARDRVAAWVKRSPKFAAIDRAIGQQGWKIVAMLRLSPAVPFNLQNYAYGLTSIGFWTCVLTSWLFMLPGTFLYVYLGRILGVAAFTAAGGGRELTPGEWVFLGLGLLATVAVTLYITRLARRALRQHAELEEVAGESKAESAPRQDDARRPWATAALALAALVVLVLAGVTCAAKDQIRSLFGPPQVAMTEAFAARPGGPSVDHSTLDALLKEHVDDAGWVDYEGLKRDAARLDDYLAVVAGVPYDELGRDEKLALLINAYNAFTLRLILDHWPGIDSIRAIPENRRWDGRTWPIGPHRWTLNQIEHEQIRPHFREPRVHFALVCAAIGCPPLRNEAYRADRLQPQLQDQAVRVHSHDRWFRFDRQRNVVHLTPLYKWYHGDFEQTAGSVLEFAAGYSDELAAALKAGDRPRIAWLDYNWTLNSRDNKESRP